MASIYGSGRLDRRAVVRLPAGGEFVEWVNVRPTGDTSESIGGQDFVFRDVVANLRANSRTSAIRAGTVLVIDGASYEVRSVPFADLRSGMVPLNLRERGDGAFYEEQIAGRGRPIALKRGPAEITVIAIVHGYQPAELVGGIIQGDTLVIVSPASLRGSIFADGPKAGDTVRFDARVRRALSIDPVHLGTDVVRYDLRVRG